MYISGLFAHLGWHCRCESQCVVFFLSLFSRVRFRLLPPSVLALVEPLSTTCYPSSTPLVFSSTPCPQSPSLKALISICSTWTTIYSRTIYLSYITLPQ